MSKNFFVVVNENNETSQVIARAVRNLGVYCEIVNPNKMDRHIDDSSIYGVIVAKEHSEYPGQYVSIDKKHKLLEIAPDQAKNSGVLLNILKDFVFNQCSADMNWSIEEYANELLNETKDTIKDGKVLLALSGGVDSSVVAALLEKAIGSQLYCIFVDHGLMRKNEGDEVENVFAKSGMNFIRVNAKDRFLEKLKGITEPENKRKIIGEEFIRVFEEEAKKIGHVDFLAQGTIYPDIVESDTGNGEVIKSHHNVGGLPDCVDFKDIIEPLKNLFKDEVRQLGRVLGLPEKLVSRQPFPGPGLAIRVIGEVTPERLDILREADFIFRNAVESAGIANDINQYFAVLTNIRSVGVSNSVRTYDYTLALRAVKTTDFMTAEWAKIPYDLLDEISNKITTTVEGINRIVYDITNKPPSTIEWE